MAGTKDYAIAALAADMEGTLWLAGNSYDAAGAARARFAQRVRTTPFGNTPIGASISETLGGAGPGPRPVLWQVADGHWAAHDLPQPPAGHADHVITALFAVSGRDVWVGTTAALLRFDVGKLRGAWTTAAEGAVSDITRDGKGRMWWAGPDGVRLYSPDKGIQNFTETPATAVAVTHDGTVWVAHAGTVRRFAKGVITRYSAANAGVGASAITALVAREEGGVVASHNRMSGSFGTGAAASVAGAGLSLNRIVAVAGDPFGPVWCSTDANAPLFRIGGDFTGRAPLSQPLLRPTKDPAATIPPTRLGSGGAWFEVVGPWQPYVSRFDPATQKWATTPQQPMPDIMQTGATAFAIAANGGLWTADATN